MVEYLQVRNHRIELIGVVPGELMRMHGEGIFTSHQEGVKVETRCSEDSAAKVY